MAPIPPTPDAVLLPASFIAQVAQVAAALVLKPLYMGLALALAVLIRRRNERAVVRIRRGLVAFLAGEVAAAASWAAGGSPLDILDLLHGLGMVVMPSLVCYGVFELLDEHVWHFTDAHLPCSATPLCGRCWKREPAPCAMQRLFLFAIPALGLLALLPLAASAPARHDTVLVFGTPVTHDATLAIQLFQFRVLPVASACAFVVALALVSRGERGVVRAAPWFFAALGVLAFVLLRFGLQSAYAAMPVWSDFWEEVAELATTSGVAVVLWALWKPLGLGTRSPEPPGAAGR